MSFIAYVIAWLVICVLFAIIMSLLNQFIVFLRDHTPLGSYHRHMKEEQLEKERRQLASFILEEMSSRNVVVEDVKNNEIEVKEG